MSRRMSSPEMLSSSESTAPPRLAEALVRWSVPLGEVGESILGDLREELRATPPPASPKLWYWRQALGFVPRFAIARRLAAVNRTLGFRPSCQPPDHRRGDTMLDTLLQDLRYALRTFRKNPGFTVVALVILALGIGATTAIFSVVDAVLLASLPYDEPERLVRLGHAHRERSGNLGFSPQDFADLEAAITTFESLAAYSFSPGQTVSNLTGDGEPAALQRAFVSAGFFASLGRSAALGRTLVPADMVVGEDRVVVMSHGLWQGRFGADPGIVGRVLTLGEEPVEVVGVMPASFDYPSPEAQLWMPISRVTESMIPHHRGLRWMQAFGRLAPGASLQQAREEMNSLLANLETAHPKTNEGWTRAVLTPLRDSLVGNVRPALLILFAATALVLLTACANVANLVLARSTGRRLEFAVRRSLGADRGRLIRQSLSESLILALVGGILGLALAVWGVRLLLAMSAGTLPRVGDVAPDLRLLGFALLASLLTGLLFGLIPAFGASRQRPAILLRESSASAIGGRRQGLRSFLVAGEIALATVLVLGSGLMLKSFWNLLRVDPGFDTAHVLTLNLKAPPNLSAQGITSAAYHQRLIDAVRPLPGVEVVGGSKASPLADGGEPYTFKLRDTAGNTVATVRPESGTHIVTPGYFEALGATLLTGRTFADGDLITNIIINRSLAEKLWPGDTAVGKHLAFSDEHRFEVIGVVDDIRHGGLAQPTRSAIYVQSQGFSRSSMNLFVRTTADPLATAAAVREAIWSVNPNQPISGLSRLDQVVNDNVAQPRFFAILLAAFAGLALTLAALGIYGVVAYAVGQRRRELGLRMALGARGGDVVGMVVAQTMTTCLAGLGLGLAAAFWLSRLLASQLFGVSPTDAATFATVAGVLGLITLAACFVPALRAMRVNPIEALRGAGSG